MAFWGDIKNRVQQTVKPKQQQENNNGYTAVRGDGRVSSFVPKVRGKAFDQQQNGFTQGNTGFGSMAPAGVDPNLFQGMGGQNGAVPPQQGMPQQTPFGRTGFQQPMNAPQTGFQQPMNPGAQMGGQIPPRPQAQFQGQQRGFEPQQPMQGQFQVPQSAPQPQQEVVPIGGADSYVVDGNAYKMVLRVAQITGVPSCFRVIEFMYNNESVIVNAEQVTDPVESDRCMDLIFGAACAMKQRLMRVSGKQIYLITPPQVYVAPFENLRRMGMEDIANRWPGAMQTTLQGQPAPGNVQPFTSRFRQDDFAGGGGRRVNRAPSFANGYTDYGGFGAKIR